MYLLSLLNQMLRIILRRVVNKLVKLKDSWLAHLLLSLLALICLAAQLFILDAHFQCHRLISEVRHLVAAGKGTLLL